MAPGQRRVLGEHRRLAGDRLRHRGADRGRRDLVPRLLGAGAVTFVDSIAAIPSGGTVTLELSPDGVAGPWEPIATGIANSGRCQWRIPPDTPSLSSAFIRRSLTVGSDTATTTTPQPFTILGGGALFADGFESGDAARWSAVAP